MSTTRALSGSALSVRLMALLKEYGDTRSLLRELELSASSVPGEDREKRDVVRAKLKFVYNALQAIIPDSAAVGEYHIDDLANSLLKIEDTALDVSEADIKLKAAQASYDNAKGRLDNHIEGFRKKLFSPCFWKASN